MTSNVDSDLILEGRENEVESELHKYFKPEFLNRIDDIILFNKLTKDVLKEILANTIKEIENRLKDLHISIKLDDKAVNYFIDKGYDEYYGARPLKRLVSKELETLIARKIINDEIKENDTINVTVENDTIKLG